MADEIGLLSSPFSNVAICNSVFGQSDDSLMRLIRVFMAQYLYSYIANPVQAS